jgi:hypothetical protein
MLLFHGRGRQFGAGSANVLQSVALSGDLSIHGAGRRIDLAGRNRARPANPSFNLTKRR